jgi:hypothetical protein
MRRLLSVLLACALVPVVAGCGAEKTVKDAVDPVAQAATKTADAGSVQIAMTGKVSAAGQEIPIDAKGAYDLRAKRGSLDVTTTVPGTGQVRIKELIDGLVVYMSSDGLGSTLPAGKHWVRLDLAKLSGNAGFDLAALQQLGGGTDPTQFLGYLKKAGDVEKVGSEEIDGTPTTHYRATIDLDKLAKSAASVRQIEQLTGGKTIPTEVWIDGQGRARRQTIDYSTQSPVPAHIQFAIDYKRFGVPVDVHPPDKSDTVDLADVTGG